MDSVSRLDLVNRYVEDYREELLELASNLIKIPSENIAPNGNEKECQEYLFSYLSDIKGIKTDYFTPLEVEGIEDHPAYKAGREYANRPNVVAVKNGAGDGRSVVFSSHIDTVSRNPLPWKISNPFSGEIVEGKLYGRGSFDMKGGLASTVICLKILAEKDLHFNGKVIVESVVDEENAGANGTLASRLKGYNGDIAIVPEPSMLDICPASKGGKVYRIDLEGRAGTGYGGEETINPVYGIGLLAYNFSKYEKAINSIESQGGPYYKDELSPRTVIVDKIQAGDLNPGGNIGIPDKAWFSFFVNTLPGYTEEILDKEINELVSEAVSSHEEVFANAPNVQSVSRYLWPYEVDRNHPGIESLVKTSIECGLEKPVVTGAKFACDGFIFNRYFNTPVIIFGPRGENAHAQDEFVYTEDLILLTKIYLNFILNWCR